MLATQQPIIEAAWQRSLPLTVLVCAGPDTWCGPSLASPGDGRADGGAAGGAARRGAGQLPWGAHKPRTGGAAAGRAVRLHAGAVRRGVKAGRREAGTGAWAWAGGGMSVAEDVLLERKEGLGGADVGRGGE